MKTSKTASFVGTAFLLVVAVSVIIPLLAVISAALQPTSTLVPKLTWPSNPQWGNFVEAFTTANFGSLMKSSGIIAIVVVPLTMACATLAGYAFAVLRVRFSGALFALFIAGLTLPYEAIVIPLYFDLQSVGLIDTYWAVILPLVGAFMPFGIFWMRTHFESMPADLVEAGQIDGAGSLTIFARIMLPTARPALTTLGLLTFMWAWNQFLLALILIRDPAKRTAPSGLGTFVMQYGQNIPLLCAGTLLVIAPVVVVYLFFQRHFIAGLIQGAVK
jgi:raffinose/stachyose/melibiose transport system permease protein